jgi:hypothetical protein
VETRTFLLTKSLPVLSALSSMPLLRVILRLCKPSQRWIRANQHQERSGRYEIKDFPYATVRRMVEYLYRGDYIGWTEGTDDADRDKAAALLLHLKMFSIADKYGITGLLSISSKRFITTLGMKVDAAVLEKVVPRIYELNIPARSAIRQSFITLCRKWLSAEWRDALAANLLDQLTEDAPEFTKDLLLSTLRAPRFGHCHCCSPNSLAPLEPLQFKCKTCGKGGASPCSIGRECTYCFRIEDMQE